MNFTRSIKERFLFSPFCFPHSCECNIVSSAIDRSRDRNARNFSPSAQKRARRRYTCTRPWAANSRLNDRPPPSLYVTAVLQLTRIATHARTMHVRVNPARSSPECLWHARSSRTLFPHVRPGEFIRVIKARPQIARIRSYPRERRPKRFLSIEGYTLGNVVPRFRFLRFSLFFFLYE